MEQEAVYRVRSRMRSPDRKDNSKNLFGALLSKVRKLRERSRNLRELHGMSDHQLSDIGLSRVDAERLGSKSLFRDSTLRCRW